MITVIYLIASLCSIGLCVFTITHNLRSKRLLKLRIESTEVLKARIIKKNLHGIKDTECRDITHVIRERLEKR